MNFISDVFQNIAYFFSALFYHSGEGAFPILPEILILLSLSIAILLIYKKLLLSPILGYMVAGMLLGQNGFNLVRPEVWSISELGVIFLMFIIGLEMTPVRFSPMKKYMLGMGNLQFITASIFLTSALVFVVGLKAAIVMGTAMALSSTAVVLKIIMDKREINTNHGRIVLAVLLMQDLISVPPFVLVPLLGSKLQEANIATLLGLFLIKVVIAYAVIYFFNRILLKRILGYMIDTENHEVLLLTVLAVVLGASYITEHLQLSMAFGAFVAGMMIAKVGFSEEVNEVIEPFYSLFMGLFFVAVGTKLDYIFIFKHLHILLGLAIALMLVKYVAMRVVCWILGIERGISNYLSIALSQSGEFALVLLSLAMTYNIIDSKINQMALTIVGITMALTYSFEKIARLIWAKVSEAKNEAVAGIYGLQGHVIVVGSSSLTDLMELLISHGINVIGIDNDIESVLNVNLRKLPVYYGDIKNPSMAKKLSLAEAADLVLYADKTSFIEDIVDFSLKINPHLQIYVCLNKHDEEIMKLQSKYENINFIIAEREALLRTFKLILKNSSLNKAELERVFYSL